MKSFILVIVLINSLMTRDVTITVVAKNVQIGKGFVVVEIWSDEKMFLKKPLMSKTLKAVNQTLEFTFELTEGRYAISVYQDLNDNKKLDLGIFNIPKEPVGFGNNFRPKFSAPKFEDCTIFLFQSMKTEIELK